MIEDAASQPSNGESHFDSRPPETGLQPFLDGWYRKQLEELAAWKAQTRHELGFDDEGHLFTSAAHRIVDGEVGDRVAPDPEMHRLETALADIALISPEDAAPGKQPGRQKRIFDIATGRFAYVSAQLRLARMRERREVRRANNEGLFHKPLVRFGLAAIALTATGVVIRKYDFPAFALPPLSRTPSNKAKHAVSPTLARSGSPVVPEYGEKISDRFAKFQARRRRKRRSATNEAA